MSGCTPAELPRATQAVSIVRDLVAHGRESYEDEPQRGGIWDDGYACAFCGIARYATSRHRYEAATADHEPECIWRRAVEWFDSESGKR